MKTCIKHFSMFLTCLLVALLFSPTTVQAATGACPNPLAGLNLTLNSNPQINSPITFLVDGSNASGTARTLWILINPNPSNGTQLASIPINLDSNLNGSATYPQGFPVGHYQATIFNYSYADPFMETCSNPVDFTISDNPSNLTCDWIIAPQGFTHPGQPTLLLGGFSSPQSGAGHYVRFRCSDSCGNIVQNFFYQIFGANVTQSFPLTNICDSVSGVCGSGLFQQAPPGQSGTYWIGISGEWDQSLVDALQANVNIQNNCGRDISVQQILSAPSGGIGALVSLAGTTILNDACTAVLGNGTFSVRGEVGTVSGTNFQPLKGCDMRFLFTNGEIIPLPQGPPNEPYSRIHAYCNSGNLSDGTSETPTEWVYTAFGCIRVSDWTELIETILTLGAGTTGGLAILLIIYASFLIIISTGNPQRITAGKELLNAAIIGLLLLLFGAFILRLIGVQILSLPGFGT